MKYWYVITVILLVSWIPQDEISNNVGKNNRTVHAQNIIIALQSGKPISASGNNGVLFQCATVIRAYVAG